MRSISARSAILPSKKGTSSGTTRREPFDRSSMTETPQPASLSASTAWLPIYPAPPVTNTLGLLIFVFALFTFLREPRRHGHSGLNRSLRLAFHGRQVRRPKPGIERWQVAAQQLVQRGKLPIQALR